MRSKFSDAFEGSRYPATKVILVRHGQSTSNAQGRYQGRCDQSVLTEKGRRCAYQTGVALREVTVDAIYTSPLKRAQETANQILAAMSTDARLPIQADRNLREIDLPAWQGLPFKYVQEQFAEDYRCWQERPHQFQMQIPQADWLVQRSHATVVDAIKQCFPVLELYEQARQFWQEVLPLHVGKTLLVVSHSATNRALISTAIGLTPECYHALQQSNCGISILNFPVGWRQQVQLTALNLTAHLGESLPKLKAKQGLRLLLVPSDAICEAEVDRLAELLKPVGIDFSLRSDSDSQEITDCILQHHPTTLELQVLRQDFLQVWQQTIQSRRSHFASTSGREPLTLTTGLVVACESSLKWILGQILGMRSEELRHLQVAGALSVIHYPGADSSPVLQGLNISGAALLSV